jgi:ribosomal protein S18 acetylase RimI-like enzyme
MDDQDVGGVLPSEEGKVGVVISHDRIIGIIAGIHRGKMLYVWGLYVATRVQRTGIGAALMAWIVDGIDDDVRVLVSVEETSSNAAAFYASLGLQRMKERLVDGAPTQFEMKGIVNTVRTCLAQSWVQTEGF